MPSVDRRPARRSAVRRLRLLLTGSMVIGLLGAGASSLHAQTAPAAPVRPSVDGNGVDLFNGTFDVVAQGVPVGTGASGLGASAWNFGNGWSDSTQGFLNLSGSTMTVSIGSQSDDFSVSGSTYTSIEGNGATLTLNGATYTYTNRDGDVAHFDGSIINLRGDNYDGRLSGNYDGR